MIFDNGTLTINNPIIWIGSNENKEKWFDNIIKICIRPVLFVLAVVCLERSIHFFGLAFK